MLHIVHLRALWGTPVYMMSKFYISEIYIKTIFCSLYHLNWYIDLDAGSSRRRLCDPLLHQRLSTRWHLAWWRHQMETFSALLAICAGNSPVSGEFPAQRPVTRSFDIFFDLRLNKRLSKQSWGCWFEILLCPIWRQCNAMSGIGLLSLGVVTKYWGTQGLASPPFVE